MCEAREVAAIEGRLLHELEVLRLRNSGEGVSGRGVHGRPDWQGRPEGRADHHFHVLQAGAGGGEHQLGSLRFVLIDGEELTKLDVRFNLGVRVARTVEIKRIDLDYFEDADTE